MISKGRNGVLLACALAVGCATSPPITTDELSERLDRHNLVLVPEGDGPFPAVLLLHACFGNLGHVDRWARTLQAHGYAAVVVNSMAARGLDGHFDNVAVCSGLVLRPTDRARDVTLGIEKLVDLERVDSSRVAVVGFSHGGWTALEFLGWPGGTQPGEAALRARESVRSVAVVYPYCGGDVQATLDRWPRKVHLLMLLAENDRAVGTARCEDVAREQRARGYDISLHVYPGVEHGYDVPPELVWGRDERYDEAAAADTQRRILEFLAQTLGSPVD